MRSAELVRSCSPWDGADDHELGRLLPGRPRSSPESFRADRCFPSLCVFVAGDRVEATKVLLSSRAHSPRVCFFGYIAIILVGLGKFDAACC
jgi:hypothetical protein